MLKTNRTKMELSSLQVKTNVCQDGEFDEIRYSVGSYFKSYRRANLCPRHLENIKIHYAEHVSPTLLFTSSATIRVNIGNIVIVLMRNYDITKREEDRFDTGMC